MLEIRDPDGKVVSVRDYNQEMIDQYNRQGTGFYARRRASRTIISLACCCVLLAATLIGVLIERGAGLQAESVPTPATHKIDREKLDKIFAGHEGQQEFKDLDNAETEHAAK